MANPSPSGVLLPRLSPPHLAIPADAEHCEVRPDGATLDLEAHRRQGVRKALDHLAVGHTSAAFRRQRALLAVCRAVELQARVAGIGHVHVGTGPCGVMCEPMGTHRDTPWRDR